MNVHITHVYYKHTFVSDIIVHLQCQNSVSFVKPKDVCKQAQTTAFVNPTNQKWYLLKQRLQLLGQLIAYVKSFMINKMIQIILHRSGY